MSDTIEGIKREINRTPPDDPNFDRLVRQLHRVQRESAGFTEPIMTGRGQIGWRNPVTREERLAVTDLFQSPV